MTKTQLFLKDKGDNTLYLSFYLLKKTTINGSYYQLIKLLSHTIRQTARGTSPSPHVSDRMAKYNNDDQMLLWRCFIV